MRLELGEKKPEEQSRQTPFSVLFSEAFPRPHRLTLWPAGSKIGQPTFNCPSNRKNSMDQFNPQNFTRYTQKRPYMKETLKEYESYNYSLFSHLIK